VIRRRRPWSRERQRADEQPIHYAENGGAPALPSQGKSRGGTESPVLVSEPEARSARPARDARAPKSATSPGFRPGRASGCPSVSGFARVLPAALILLEAPARVPPAATKGNLPPDKMYSFEGTTVSSRCLSMEVRRAGKLSTEMARENLAPYIDGHDLDSTQSGVVSSFTDSGGTFTIEAPPRIEEGRITPVAETQASRDSRVQVVLRQDGDEVYG